MLLPSKAVATTSCLAAALHANLLLSSPALAVVVTSNPGIISLLSSRTPRSFLARTTTTALLATTPHEHSDSNSDDNNNTSNNPSNHPLAANDDDNNTNPSSLLSESSSSDNTTSTTTKSIIIMKPRPRSCVYMSLAMALHFGGYEFARSGCLALFLNQFYHPSAYPLAMGMVTPASLLLLYWYGNILKAKGPRHALKETTGVSVAILALGTLLCRVLLLDNNNTANNKLVVALLFVFQNSYAHLLYTQQWSFLGSVLTPTEGTQWFSLIAGASSVVCTLTATMTATTLSNHTVGLLGLMVGTCVTLAMSMLLADRAYQLAQDHGFDPSPAMTNKKKNGGDKTASQDESLPAKTKRLFQTSPTLAGLFGEVISFQSLSTVLNVCFVRQLKDTLPMDTDRAAFTGKFYALVNGSSGLMQFLVLPLARKYLEPQWVYRFLPLLLMPLLLYAAIQPTSSLMIAAAAFFALKSMDYSIRNVSNEMVYQPLDFDARYLGKEVIGVFANRFGKSGMSLILSGLTSAMPSMGARQLSQLAVAVGMAWSSCSVYLSRHVVTNAEAEAKVQQRKQQKEGERQGGETSDAKKTQ